MTIDRKDLENFLADRLRLVSLNLVPLAVQCAAPVFKGLSIGSAPMFVKVVARETARRAMRFLCAAEGCELLPHPVVREPIDYRGVSVMCMEWKEAKHINAEKMTDAQLDGFLDGCRRLSNLLKHHHGHALPLSVEDSMESQYEALRRYDLKHPLMGCLLRPLLTIPKAARCYDDRTLAVIHGDLQSKNYGFDGDGLSVVYDTDDLTVGLACEDAAYAFTERARRAELSKVERKRLVLLFRRLVAASPWPRQDWRIAVNHARLRIAARRLTSHPDAFFIAIDIMRRDRRLRALADVLETDPC